MEGQACGICIHLQSPSGSFGWIRVLTTVPDCRVVPQRRTTASYHRVVLVCRQSVVPFERPSGGWRAVFDNNARPHLRGLTVMSDLSI